MNILVGKHRRLYLLPPFPWVDAFALTQISGCYLHLLNDPGLSPSGSSIGHLIIITDAFLNLTHQVQTLAKMMQTIDPLLPQLAQL